ncbi:MAG TPA: hypothetical protein VGP07_05005 [Polyangia bacterium]
MSGGERQRSKLSPGELADVLGALPVRVTGVEVVRSAVALEDYPGGPRPSSVVRLSGDGQVGCGENVAFTDEEHARFAAGAAGLLVSAGRVDASIAPAARGYERAALEAALIDLALRQTGTTLAALTGVARASLRVVLSFAARSDAAAHVWQLRAAGRTEALKIDVDPTWDQAAREELARQPGIAILDFKGRGDARLAAELSALFPEAIFEDPPGGTTHENIARDASLDGAGAVAVALARGESVNLKAPRMGGPLEVLRGLELAARTGRPGAAYLGGMFEVDVGRTQARLLAALFCSDATNDLAPLGFVDGPEQALTVGYDGPGFDRWPEEPAREERRLRLATNCITS